MRNITEICQILDIFKQQDPSPQSELNYHNAYTLLVAIVLSAQSTDKGVNKAAVTVLISSKIGQGEALLRLKRDVC